MASPRPRRTSLRFVEGQTYDPSPTARPKRISCKAAAEMLGPTWTEHLVLQWCRSGAIPHYTVSSRIYLLEGELREWMASPRSIRVKEQALREYIDGAIEHATALLAALEVARKQIGGEA